ncbi:MAG: hypothetical protein V4643_01670 [Bacteroidota bacterium]
MNRTIKIVLPVLILLFIACSHYDSLQKNGVESSANKSSHNSGQDCMRCHNDDKHEASFYAWWNVAGTIFKGSGALNTEARIELWSEPNGKGFRILSLATDKDANFYSEKIIKFNGGCYPIAISGVDTVAMSQSFNGGGCNSCHGVSTNKIIVN